jgi:hypothetical protein
MSADLVSGARTEYRAFLHDAALSLDLKDVYGAQLELFIGADSVSSYMRTIDPVKLSLYFHNAYSLKLGSTILRLAAGLEWLKREDGEKEYVISECITWFMNEKPDILIQLGHDNKFDSEFDSRGDHRIFFQTAYNKTIGFGKNKKKKKAGKK